MNEFICPQCQGKEKRFELTKDHSIHYGKEVCTTCGHWIQFVRAPQNEKRRRKDVIIKAHEKYNVDGKLQCHFCDRTQDELGEYETITIDHVQELRDGGEDHLENTRPLCTACHKLRLWVKTYLNLHLKKFYEKNGDSAAITK